MKLKSFLLFLIAFPCYFLNSLYAESDPILIFRKSLSGKQEKILSNGSIDTQSLTRLIFEFAHKNKKYIQTEFEKSIHLISPSLGPDPNKYSVIAELNLSKIPANLFQSMTMMLILKPDLKSYLRQNLINLLLTADILSRKEQRTSWLQFFNAAEPEWNIYKKTPDKLSVGMDYASREILVFHLEKKAIRIIEKDEMFSVPVEISWAMVGFQWYRRK